MFSGIVEESAEVLLLESTEQSARLKVKSGLDLSSVKTGDSICIDGVCLTVVERINSELSFDLSVESLKRSTLGALKTGSKVNLERALKIGDRINGHFVFGHVDGVSKIVAREEQGASVKFILGLPPELKFAIVPKGSVAIDGVGLTVGEIWPDAFSVYLVPHSLNVTKFLHYKPGDVVNVEIDMLARYAHNRSISPE